MEDQEFQRRADEALTDLARRLADASEEHGFESDFRAGAIVVEFDSPPAKFVVSPNSPVKQIWVSALSRSFKFAWDDARSAFVHPETGQTLEEMMAAAISQQLSETVAL